MSWFHLKDELTRDIGMHTAILFEDTWYDSSSAFWDISHQYDFLSIKLSWEDIPLKITWEIRPESPGMKWTAYMDVKEPLKLEKIVSGLILKSDYTRWFNCVEEGSFTPPDETWKTIFLSERKGMVFGVENDGRSSGLIVENLYQGTLSVQNAPKSINARALRIELGKSGRLLETGRHRILHLNVFSFESIKNDFEKFKKEKIAASYKAGEFTKNDLRLVLDKTSLHLYCSEYRLSEKAGLHSAAYIDGKWFDAAQGKWLFERVSNDHLCIEIDWAPLPIYQSWELKINSNNTLDWQIETHITDENLKVEKVISGVSLDSRYVSWFGDYQSGVFDPQDNAWDEVIGDTEQGAIGVINAGRLPGLIFKNLAGTGSTLLVQNSNRNTNARYLQAVKHNDAHFSLKKFNSSQAITLVKQADDLKGYLRGRFDEVVESQGIDAGSLKLFANQ